MGTVAFVASLLVVCVQTFMMPPSTNRFARNIRIVALRSQDRSEIFGRPHVSRYESFYGGTEKETIETEAVELTNNEPVQTSNPFYVGYEMEELAMLWDVHTTNFGERSSDQSGISETAQDAAVHGLSNLPESLGVGQSPTKLGLHELVLDACREADAKKSQ